jgi:hypothetical protein
MWVVMSAAERERFLASVHVGVMSAAVGTAGQTLTVPVWYSYQPGGLLTLLLVAEMPGLAKTARLPFAATVSWVQKPAPRTGRRRRSAQPSSGRAGFPPAGWFGRIDHRSPPCDVACDAAEVPG